MTPIETDYLVVGAGAVGMAFVDTLLTEDPDCHITIVDKHAKPGGHWNDAYSFVTLHQPSATYGVNSRELGTDRLDTQGHNTGMAPLATHAEILAYYEQLMQERFLPSGRVSYHPLSEYRGEENGEPQSIHAILSGEETPVTVRRKLVDGTFFQTSVPSTHNPPFDIGEGARLTVPGDLPKLWKQAGSIPQNFIILGGGKTAMDTGVWLLEAGIAPERIGWVRPRDSWMFNRKYLQPAYTHLEELLTFQIAQMRAAASSETGAEMCAKMGEEGVLLRIDPDVSPEMFHFAVISEAEVELLGQIKRVFRQGRVTRIEPGAMLFGDERVEVPEGTLFIDCTASAVPFELRNRSRPFFEEGLITLQATQTPLIPYSAALAAFVEANFDTDEERNAIVPVSPLTDTVNTYPAVVAANLRSMGILSQNPKVSEWNNKSRLHPSGPAIVKLAAEGSPKLAKMGEMMMTIQECAPAVMALGEKAMAEHLAT